MELSRCKMIAKKILLLKEGIFDIKVHLLSKPFNFGLNLIKKRLNNNK
jgi:hypothetical protein